MTAFSKPRPPTRNAELGTRNSAPAESGRRPRFRLPRFAFSIGLLLCAFRVPCSAFSLLGPVNEPWQVPLIGYNLGWRQDVGAPKNLGEEYRRNKPVLFYGFDSTFLDYFGSNGVWAVEQAFAVMNSLTNVSSYSPELLEFPLAAKAVNFRASALYLMDLKSMTLSLLMENMGLAEPERYTWCIHNRWVGPGGCPNDVGYLVVRRNFAIQPTALDTLQYSSFVNGSRLSFFIDEDCNTAPFDLDPAADAIEVFADPINGDLTSAVASFQVLNIDTGGFWTGLTRDDVAGLRYLLRFGNVNWEALGTNAVLLSTNRVPSSLNFLTTSNLADLASVALTNTTAGLQTLFPNLLVLSTTPYLTNVITTNLLAYFTNYPWSPAGSAATLVYATNYDTNVVFNYRHVFGNVVSNTLIFPNGYVFTNQNVFAYGLAVTSNRVTVIDTNIGPSTQPWAPPGTLVTNVTTRTVWTNIVVGDYFIPPTNLCGVLLLSNVLTKVTTTTNTVLQATNNLGTNVQFFSRTFITYFTNHNFAYFPVDCVTNATTLYHGIERVQFVRRDYDSLIGRFFEPLQTNYTMVAVTNSQNVTQTVARIVSQPDILFTAEDMAPGPSVGPRYFYPVLRRTTNFIQNSIGALAGPGTIESPTVFTFDKAGPVTNLLAAGGPYFLDERSGVGENPLWATYDDTTNAPVIYPNGTSIEMLENQILIQITTASLPDGQVGQVYPAQQLAAQGGTPPYTWSLAPTSPGLPPALQLSVAGVLGGTNWQAGVFDFTVRLTDAGARYVDRPFTLTVLP